MRQTVMPTNEMNSFERTCGEMTYKSGDDILIRHVFRGRVTYALPCRVVVHDSERVVTYLAPETIVPRPKFAAREDFLHLLAKGSYEYEDFVWYNHHLHFTRFGDAHAFTLIWDHDWQFRWWYINLQEPLRKTRLGFDTSDQVLDILGFPDGTWRWKDEHELELAVELDLFSPEQAEEIRMEGERAVSLIENHPVLVDGWVEWRPDPSWTIPPALPVNWHVVLDHSNGRRHD